MTKKIIQYYTKSVYGNSLDYVVEAADAQILACLTGKKTVTNAERELIRGLTGGLVEWQQVLEPAKK